MSLPPEKDRPITDYPAVRLLMCCQEIYAHKPLSREAFSVYFNIMNEAGFEQSEQALEMWLRTQNTFPTPADIIRTIEQLRQPQSGQA